MGKGMANVVCSAVVLANRARPYLDSENGFIISWRSQPFHRRTHASEFSLSDSGDKGHCSSTRVAPMSPVSWMETLPGSSQPEAPGEPGSEVCFLMLAGLLLCNSNTLKYTYSTMVWHLKFMI